MYRFLLVVSLACLVAAYFSGGGLLAASANVDLLGPDANHDGVRDDIEAYIDKAYTDQAHRNAALQAARAMQGVFVVDLDDPLAVRQVNRLLARADQCIYQVFRDANATKPAAQVSSELEAMAVNTKQRLHRYLDFNKALDGAIWSQSRGDSCE